MTRRIFNEASKNHMTYMSGRVKEPDFIYVDVQILNMRQQFKNDEEFVKHLSELLNINLQIVKKKGDK